MLDYSPSEVEKMRHMKYTNFVRHGTDTLVAYIEAKMNQFDKGFFSILSY